MTCAPWSRASSIAARRAADWAAQTVFCRASRLFSGTSIFRSSFSAGFWPLCGLDLAVLRWPGGGLGFLERLRGSAR